MTVNTLPKHTSVTFYIKWSYAHMWRYIDMRNFISLSQYGKLYHNNWYIDNIAHHYYTKMPKCLPKTGKWFPNITFRVNSICTYFRVPFITGLNVDEYITLFTPQHSIMLTSCHQRDSLNSLAIPNLGIS